ncbi:MAG: glycosyltransferase family 2 protein [Verrucomicrobiota bacterium]
MNKLPISVSMISGAEEARIGRALESVCGWVSEIIIVLNADVQDGTEAIAMRYGAKVFREPWKGHVAQKNSAAAKVTQPWVLGLDADEVISPDLQQELVHLFSSPQMTARYAAYSFPRCTFYLGRWIRHGDWYPDRQTRLWQRDHATWQGIDPHDKLVVNGTGGRLRGELLHYSMENLERQLVKISTYADCFAKNRLAKGQRPGLIDFAVRPLWRFMRCYLLRGGFCDGWVGFYLAWQTAFACLTRYAKVREALTNNTACLTSPSSSSHATPAR